MVKNASRGRKRFRKALFAQGGKLTVIWCNGGFETCPPYIWLSRSIAITNTAHKQCQSFHSAALELPILRLILSKLLRASDARGPPSSSPACTACRTTSASECSPSLSINRWR